eukprot:5003252-Pyramimonas_sp.AAC.1
MPGWSTPGAVDGEVERRASSSRRCHLLRHEAAGIEVPGCAHGDLLRSRNNRLHVRLRVHRRHGGGHREHLE